MHSIYAHVGLLLISQHTWTVIHDIAEIITQPAATIGAGICVLYSARLAFKASVENRKSTDDGIATTDAREREAARQDRYAKIAENLSDEKPTIRLAGAYGLVALADEWSAVGNHGQRNVAIELVCAYLRSDRGEEKHADVKQAFLRALKTHTQGGRGPSWPGTAINLTGANLKFVNFEDSNLSGAMLDDADLAGAKLNGAQFVESTIVGANFSGARMERCNLQRAVMSGCDFKFARLGMAQLQDSIFARRLKSENGDIATIKCDLVRADLINAKAQGTNFSGADFGDLDPRPVAMLAIPAKVTEGGVVEVAEQRIQTDENTKWPEGFDIAEAIRSQIEF